MKKIIMMVTMVIISTIMMAETIHGIVKDTEGRPLIGVNVYWKGSTEGLVTDAEGRFAIEHSSSTNKLMLSFLGYKSLEVSIEDEDEHHNDEHEHADHAHEDEHEEDHDHHEDEHSHDHTLYITMELNKKLLQEIEVTSRAKGTHISRLEPLDVTKITSAELCKAACCNLAESFVTNPSVDVSYSDAATGAKQIRLLGLSGLYVQMMTENMPSFRGLASVYGLEYIPGPWMESIQVSKGTASVINGYEAISGQINVEYKKPQGSEKLFVNAFLSDAGRKELNVNASARIGENLSTMVLGHIKDDNILIDKNGDGFLDMPMVQQVNLINRWNYHTDKYIAQYGVKVINEKRQSGQKAFYEGDAGAYGIDIGTERYEAFTKHGFIFDPRTGKSLGIQLSGSYHNQESFFGNKNYDARQSNAYLNVIYQDIIAGNDHHSYSIGGSFMYDQYDEKLDMLDLDREESVAGLFAQYTYDMHDKLVLLAGLRGDYHNEYNFFMTPRLHVKYNASKHFHLRANVGMGYRSANVLAENSYLLASSRAIEIADNLNQEKALNSGVNATFYFPIGPREATFSTDYYYTNFFQQVISDVDSDPHKVNFYNLDGKSYSHALQSQLSYEVVKGLELITAFRLTDVKQTIGAELRKKALTNRYKGLITASYQTPLNKWQIDFTTQFNGGGRIPDGTLWKQAYKPYTLLNAQVTKYFRKWSIYIGGENLSNFTMDNPIIDAANPWGSDFDASMVWGPVHGVKFYAGVRYAIERE